MIPIYSLIVHFRSQKREKSRIVILPKNFAFLLSNCIVQVRLINYEFTGSKVEFSIYYAKICEQVETTKE